MEIRVAKKETVTDKSQIDIVTPVETKYRTSIEKLKERKAYLESNILKWQNEVVEIDNLIEQAYEAVNKR